MDVLFADCSAHICGGVSDFFKVDICAVTAFEIIFCSRAM